MTFKTTRFSSVTTIYSAISNKHGITNNNTLTCLLFHHKNWKEDHAKYINKDSMKKLHKNPLGYNIKSSTILLLTNPKEIMTNYAK